MKVTVNGDDVEVDVGATVTTLLTTLGLPERGVAVALDWAVLPRSQWGRALSDGATVEVLTAVQGG